MSSTEYEELSASCITTPSQMFVDIDDDFTPCSVTKSKKKTKHHPISYRNTELITRGKKKV